MPLGKRTADGRPCNAFPTKKRRVDVAVAVHVDLLSRLSDELVLRILSFLSLPQLLGVSCVCRRLHRLSADSQLWRQLYYLRFVLPRALRIPGFQPSRSTSGGACTRTVLRHANLRKSRLRGDPVDWKRQYKLRHNWTQGRCAVEELDVGRPQDGTIVSGEAGTLVKVADGLAITADAHSGLRIWDLKTKQLRAEACVQDSGTSAAPTCLAVDDELLADDRGPLGVAVGFADGTFAIWSFTGGHLHLRYDHTQPSPGRSVGRNGPGTGDRSRSGSRGLVQVAYSFPYLMTASEDIAVSLYSLRHGDAGRAGGRCGDDETTRPHLITYLKSHSPEAPLALSIRRRGGPGLDSSGSTIASVAFTLPTRDGWTIGIQDFHIKHGTRHGSEEAPSEIFSTRLAHAATPTSITASSLHASRCRFNVEDLDGIREGTGTGAGWRQRPKVLCYTHPYLLATLDDNTLILYLCTSDASALSISPGIRLWGHTSGIADAEITSRGKAVSVSCRGDELRVWELEGRSGGTSIAVRPSTRSPSPGERVVGEEWDDNRRNWVGFDDEMVTVLQKETRGGKESLVVYDFT